MDTNETQRLIHLGFNHGYVLSQVAPGVLKRLLTMKHAKSYLLGLNKGKAEFEQHKAIVLGKKQDKRDEKLKKISGKQAEKEPGKDGLERG